MQQSLKQLFMIAVVLFLSAFAPSPEGQVAPMQQLYMLKELNADIAKVGILWNDNLATEEDLTAVRRAATSLKVELFVAKIGELSDVATQFRMLMRNHQIQALWVVKNDGVLDSDTGRSFLIKEAMKSGIAVLAPDKEWVDAGATIALKKGEEGLHLMVNQAAVNGLSLSVPDQYLERTEFLAAK